ARRRRLRVARGQAQLEDAGRALAVAFLLLRAHDVLGVEAAPPGEPALAERGRHRLSRRLPGTARGPLVEAHTRGRGRPVGADGEDHLAALRGNRRDEEREHREHGHGYFTLLPSFTTTSTRWRSSIVVSTSPRTAITSASRPGASVPSSFSFFRKRAGQRVAPAIACMGVAPSRTHVASSRQVESLWKLAGMPLSVPPSLVTP